MTNAINTTENMTVTVLLAASATMQAVRFHVGLAENLAAQNTELEKSAKQVILAAISDNVMYDDFLSAIKESYVNSPSWPVNSKGKKLGENKARNIHGTGKEFNNIQSRFRSRYFAKTDEGFIRETTKEERAPKIAKTNEENAPETNEELPMAAKPVSIEELTAEQIAGILLAKCNNDVKEATKVLKAVAKA